MIKVLVVDDSAIVRRVLSDELSKATDIEVVGTASDAYIARDKIVSLRPDVITLDLEMPRMGGLKFLEKLMMHHPLPVIVVSSLTAEGSEAAVRAMELGAVDVVAKPGSGYSVSDISRMLVDRIRIAAVARPSSTTPQRTSQAASQRAGAAMLEASHGVVAIGASTGGVEAIRSVLLSYPANGPATLIVQHMPAGFTGAFARRLNEQCAMRVREAQDGDSVMCGQVLIAPGDRHMLLRRRGGGYQVEVKDGPTVHHQRPSVDVLFHSVARNAGAEAVGVIMTGMGADGARGMLAMRQAGATTIAQDQSSCTVFGMPREAIRLDAASVTAPLSKIADRILQATGRLRQEVAGGRP